MEILMELNQGVPVRIRLELFDASIDGALSLFIAQENAGEASRKFGRYFPERKHLARAGGELDFEIVAQVVMELL